jgi:hypothetical protein
MILTLRIIERSINANYVPFAVFETFHDDSLARLLASFEKCSSLVPFSDLTEIPKLDRTLQQVNCSVITVFPDYPAHNLIASIISIGLQSVNRESIRWATDSLRKLACSPGVTLVDHTLFRTVTWRMWHLTMHSSEWQQNAASCLARVVMVDPEGLEPIIARVKDMAIEAHANKIDEVCDSLLAAFRNQQTDPQTSTEHIKTFLRAIKPRVRNPAALFALIPQ